MCILTCHNYPDNYYYYRNITIIQMRVPQRLIQIHNTSVIVASKMSINLIKLILIYDTLFVLKLVSNC